MNGDITMGGIHDVLNYDTFYTNKIDEIALEKSKTRYFNFIYENTNCFYTFFNCDFSNFL